MRVALGSTRAKIYGLVLRQAVVVIAVGLATGVAGAVAVSGAAYGFSVICCSLA